MKNMMRYSLMVLVVSTLVVSTLVATGCKQATTEVDSEKGSSEKKGNSLTNDSQTKASDSGTANLVDVPENMMEYIYKPYASIKFTDEQKAKADVLIKQRGAELKELRTQRSNLLTEELREKREAAIKKAKASGGDVDAAEKGAVGAEIYAELSKISEKQNVIMGELRKAVKTVLTKEQIKQINEERKNDK